MKLADILLLGLTMAFLVIGTDQAIAYGFSDAYWAFMVALVTFFAFTLRKTRKPAGPAAKKPGKKGRSI